jgi:hypothetical protein
MTNIDNYNNYINKANAPLLEAMPSNTKSTHSDKYILIYLNCSSDVFDVLHDRIQTIAKDGIIMGQKGSNISVIKTDFSPSEVRDKLMRGEGSKAEIFVMGFYYDGFAGWLSSENNKNVKYIFREE